MALKISKNVGLTDIVSVGEKPFIRKTDSVQVDYNEIPNYPLSPDMSLYNPNPAYNPITTEHPITGSAVDVRLYLYNDNPAKKYTMITIDPTDIVATDESSWAQLAPDNAGVAGTYLAGSAALTIAGISDSNVAKSFWIQVTTPAVSETQNKTDIKLTVSAKEYAI